MFSSHEAAHAISHRAHRTENPQMDLFLVVRFLATNVPYSHSDKVAGGSVPSILSFYILVVSLARCLAPSQASVFCYYSLDGPMFVSQFLRLRMRPKRTYAKVMGQNIIL